MPFHEVTLEQAKSRLGDITTEAAHDQQVTLITKYGIPAAYVVPLAMLRDLLPPVTPDVPREVLTPGPDPVSSQAIYRDPDEPTSEPYHLMPPRPPKPSAQAGLAEALRAANHSGLREALDAASGTDPGALDPHEPAVTFQQGGLAARRRRWAECLHRGLTRVDVWILISTIALVVLACLTLAWS